MSRFHAERLMAPNRYHGPDMMPAATPSQLRSALLGVPTTTSPQPASAAAGRGASSPAPGRAAQGARAAR